jgi:hypothetical protein
MIISEIYEAAKLTRVEIDNMPLYLSNDFDFYGSSAYEKLYFHFTAETAEMPYGIAKAKTGDPDLWILEHIENLMEKERTMKIKVGDLVKWTGSSNPLPGMVVKIYNHKVWRTASYGTKVNWDNVDPEPFADVAFGEAIQRLPQTDLEKLNNESR